MLNERIIKKDWLEKVLKDPDVEETRTDGTVHFVKVR